MASSPPPTPEAVARQAEIDVAEKAARLKLGEFLASGPLYTHFAFDELASGLGTLPKTIQLYCPSEQCSKIQTFEHTGSASGSHRGWGVTITYQCRNCGKHNQRYMYVWQASGFWKVGQVPELVEKIDPKLNRVLGDSRNLYTKAVRSRSFGFGIGAVSYLRRIIEDTTDSLIDLLREEKWDGWDEEERSQFDAAQKNFQYSQKIEYAAEKILPAAVFVNGRDSFTALHDVTSHGLHGLSEEKCLALFDRCNLIFTHTFRILAEHKREREEFAKELLNLKR
jgi:hypothetical protein